MYLGLFPNDQIQTQRFDRIKFAMDSKHYTKATLKDNKDKDIGLQH